MLHWLPGRDATWLSMQPRLSKFMVNDWPDENRFADAIGSLIQQAKAACYDHGARTAAFGEMVALLWADGKEHHLQCSDSPHMHRCLDLLDRFCCKLSIYQLCRPLPVGIVHGLAGSAAVA